MISNLSVIYYKIQRYCGTEIIISRSGEIINTAVIFFFSRNGKKSQTRKMVCDFFKIYLFFFLTQEITIPITAAAPTAPRAIRNAEPFFFGSIVSDVSFSVLFSLLSGVPEAVMRS